MIFFHEDGVRAVKGGFSLIEKTQQLGDGAFLRLRFQFSYGQGGMPGTELA